jgi:diguanylate cyclase (GGDEF)-like protein
MLPVQRETIASRLYLIGGLALLSVATLAAGTIYCAVGTRRVADVLYEKGIVRVVEASELEWLLEKHRRVIGAAPLAFDAEQVRRYKTASDDVKRGVEQLVERSNDTFAADVRPMLPPLWQSGDEVLRLAESFAQERALASVNRYVELAERLQDLIHQYRRSRVEVAHSAARKMSERARALVLWVASIAFLAAFLIGPLGFLLLRGMLVRLERVTAAMRQLARQDTNVELEEMTSGDEIGEMAKAVSMFKHNAEQLQQLNRWLDIALNNMAHGLSVFDACQRLVICNATYARMYALPDKLSRPGVAFAQIVRHSERMVQAVDGREASGPAGLASALIELAEGRNEGQTRQRLRDGRTIEVSVRPLPWGGWVALHEDVTDRLAAAEKITRLARCDALTGLANRLHFQEALQGATQGLEEGRTFALLAIDLDRFKEVNDTLGHPAGDALLAAVGRRLSSLTRCGDSLARLGGDEFAIIQCGAREPSDAEALARRVVEALHPPFLVQGNRIGIGATIGIALAPQDARTAEDVMRKADIALYRAKAEGKGTWRFYDAGMEGRLKARRQLEVDLGSAIQGRALELFYQPVVSLASRRVEGCEALLRWQHPVLGMVSPADFIPIAEETGLICEIGEWALSEACTVASTWPDGLFVAVNLSVAQFGGPDLALIALEALERSGLCAERLVLEVTESQLLGDELATFTILHRLRDHGVAIALDDFGTGYSSLSRLRSFPFDKIKIDQSFIRDLPQRRDCEAIVGAVVRLASSLGMTTVAEGAETEEHLARVAAAGCDAVQGHLFSHPVPAKDLATVIAEINQRLASGDVRAA